MAKSLYEVKMDERKKSKPNLITDADYFLRDKEKEAELGNPNTIDITGLTTSSQEEANDNKVRDVQKQLADMAEFINSLKEQGNTELTKKRNSNQGNKEVEGDK